MSARSRKLSQDSSNILSDNGTRTGGKPLKVRHMACREDMHFNHRPNVNGLPPEE